MSRIDSGHVLASWLQADLAARGVRAPPPAGAASAAPRATADVAALALERIRSLSTDDPDRRRKALRVYLETTLLHAFGPQLALDSGFTQLLDAVQSRMAADPQIAAVADRAAALLCDQASNS